MDIQPPFILRAFHPPFFLFYIGSSNWTGDPEPFPGSPYCKDGTVSCSCQWFYFHRLPPRSKSPFPSSLIKVTARFLFSLISYFFSATCKLEMTIFFSVNDFPVWQPRLFPLPCVPITRFLPPGFVMRRSLSAQSGIRLFQHLAKPSRKDLPNSPHSSVGTYLRLDPYSPFSFPSLRCQTFSWTHNRRGVCLYETTCSGDDRVERASVPVTSLPLPLPIWPTLLPRFLHLQLSSKGLRWGTHMFDGFPISMKISVSSSHFSSSLHLVPQSAWCQYRNAVFFRRLFPQLSFPFSRSRKRGRIFLLLALDTPSHSLFFRKNLA